MEKHATITHSMQRRQNEAGWDISHEWEGPVFAPVFVEQGMLEILGHPSDQQYITCLPWKLRILEHAGWRNGFICIREDDTFSARLFLCRYRVWKYLEMIQSRIIRTLEVWGLATIPPYQKPTWSQVHGIRSRP